MIYIYTKNDYDSTAVHKDIKHTLRSSTSNPFSNLPPILFLACTKYKN